MITEEQEAHLAMFMRVIEVIRTHEKETKEIPGFMKEFETLKEAVDKIFALLTEEERDKILDRYKEEMEYIKAVK